MRVALLVLTLTIASLAGSRGPRAEFNFFTAVACCGGGVFIRCTFALRTSLDASCALVF